MILRYARQTNRLCGTQKSLINILQITVLLHKAQEAIEQSIDFADKDQPDRAYVRYLRASEITVNLIPKHREYKDAVNERPGWHKEFADLMMVSWTELSSILGLLLGYFCSMAFLRNKLLMRGR